MAGGLSGGTPDDEYEGQWAWITPPGPFPPAPQPPPGGPHGGPLRRILPLAVAAVVAAAAGAGIATAVIHASPAPSAATSTPPTASGGGAPGNPFTGGGSPGRSGGGGGSPFGDDGGAGNGQFFVEGRVTAVHATSITVQGLTTVTIKITSATVFSGRVTGVSGVKVGDTVIAMVTRSGTGSSVTLTATRVQDPAGPLGGGEGYLPPGAGPFAGTGPGVSGPGQHSAAPGAPANAAAIARQVDPGLVDVNTVLSYQGLQGAGTGMVLTSSGEILTNNHVIEGATKISVTDVGNGKTYRATVVGYDRSQDVAVLQLTNASGLATVTTGNSATAHTGQGVVAIGNANGAGGTPSWAGGSITGLNRSITAADQAAGTSEHLRGLIETNAGIISGDSGGPMVDSSGKVIGMDTAASQGFRFSSGTNQGYAIPINEALTIAKQIEAGNSSGTVHIGPTAFLGAGVQSVTGGGSGPVGARISTVVSGGPAAQAGLAPGDTITGLGGTKVTSTAALVAVLLRESPGSSVQVTYTGPSGGSHTGTVHLASGPPQ